MCFDLIGWKKTARRVKDDQAVSTDEVNTI
jgi:hypothetical protein